MLYTYNDILLIASILLLPYYCSCTTVCILLTKDYQLGGVFMLPVIHVHVIVVFTVEEYFYSICKEIGRVVELELGRVVDI